MKKEKKDKSQIVSLLFISIAVLSVIVAIVIRKTLDNNIKEQQEEIKKQEELQKKENEIIYLEKENIKTTIDKINEIINESDLEYPISENILTTENDIYYYEIFEDIGFYVVPENYTKNQENDITKSIAIFFNTNSPNEELAKQYVKCLIKVNLPNMTNEEAIELISLAENLSKKNQALNENNGIFISYDETESNKFYIITRNYKE